MAQLQGNSALATPSSLVTISGRVVNAISGLPVSRALVRFNGRAMLTGSGGKFEFDQVADAAGNLQVEKPGFYSSAELNGSMGVYLRANQIIAPLDIPLYPEAILSGTVTAHDGDPLRHVLVSARRSIFDGSGHHWIPMAQVQTDARGRFRLPVQAGDYKLESMYLPRVNGTDQVALPVMVPSETSSNTSDSIHIGSGEEQHFQLHPATSRAYVITATFDSDIGRGFPRISARSSSGSVISLPVDFAHPTISNGVRMTLPDGTYTLTASVMSSDGIEQGETTVTITGHDVSGLVFHLAAVPTIPVELLVDDAGTSDNPQPDLRRFGLTLEDDQSHFDVFNAAIPLTTKNRTMAFTVPPGSYRLHAHSSGSDSWYIKSASYGTSDLLQQELVIGPGAGGSPIRIMVSDRTASLQGTCRIGGTPSACSVYLIPTFGSAEPVFLQRGNPQGIYNYAHLPPGTYQAIAFEQRHSADYGDTATLLPFATHVRSITLNAGEKPILDLDGVSAAEMVR